MGDGYKNIIEFRNINYEYLFNKSGDAYLTLDCGVFSSCNEKSAELLQMNARDVIGLSPSDISPKYQSDGLSSKEKVITMIEIAKKNGSHRFEWLHSRPNGNVFWAEIVLTIIRNKDRTTTTLVSWRDISKRKEIEKENDRLIERLSLATKNAHIGLWDWNILNGEVDLNEEWGNIIGYSLPELKPVTMDEIHNLTHLEDLAHLNKLLLDHFEGKSENFECETRVKHKNGQLIWILSRGKVVQRTEDGKPIRMIGTQIDITHLKESNEKLEKAIKEANKMQTMAEKADKVKAQFLANISHEIRTPMNGIIGFLDMLKYTSLSKEQTEYVNEAEMASEMMLDMINDILDYSKYENGKVTIEKIPFDVRNCIEEAIKIVASKADKKGLELVNMVHSNIPDMALGDPTRLKQVLINLLTNAIKFTEEGEVVLEVKADEPSDDGKIKLHFIVADSGCGMKRETLAILFKPFTQADASTTRKFGGTGLGLSICKEIVELMEGNIRVESEYGKGSVFFFDIWLEVQDSKENVLLDYESLRNLRILIVDDHIQNQKILSEYLRPLTPNLKVVNNGREAIQRLLEEDEEYDLILVDYQMPELNGIEFAEIFHETKETSRAKLVLLSSTYKNKLYNKDLSSLFSSVLLKPIRRNDLLKVLMVVMSQNEDNKAVESGTSRDKRTDLFRDFTPRLLLVEDNVINQKLMFKYFEKIRIPCDLANNGEEAVKAVKHTNYDLIFMDCQMPVMDGYTATRIIREHEGTDKRTPIIALTGHTMPEEIDKCKHAGMDAYLTKPVDFDKINNTLKSYVRPQKETRTSKKL